MVSLLQGGCFKPLHFGLGGCVATDNQMSHLENSSNVPGPSQSPIRHCHRTMHISLQHLPQSIMAHLTQETFLIWVPFL